MKDILRIPLQFFADEPADPQEGGTPPAGDPPAAVNYEDVFRTDKALQSFVDKRITTATKTALDNAKTDWNKKHDASLSEAERLATMTAEEKAEYYRTKYEAAEQSRKQDENARDLERQAASMFTEKGIPVEFLGTFNFREATAEAVRERVEFLAGYEIYPKGAFETKLTEALNAKLGQNPPETHVGGGEHTPENVRLATERGKTKAEALKASQKTIDYYTGGK